VPAFVLSAHTLEIAAIFVPYVVLMGALLAYMALQVHQPDHEEEPEDLADLDVRDEDPGPALMAA